MKDLKPYGPGVVKRIVTVVINTLGKLLFHSPLDNLTVEEAKLITPIFSVAHQLLMVFAVDEWTRTELFLVSEYLSQAARGVYLYVLT